MKDRSKIKQIKFKAIRRMRLSKEISITERLMKLVTKNPEKLMGYYELKLKLLKLTLEKL